jgi:parallel beta-helix repeat protein
VFSAENHRQTAGCVRLPNLDIKESPMFERTAGLAGLVVLVSMLASCGGGQDTGELRAQPAHTSSASQSSVLADVTIMSPSGPPLASMGGTGPAEGPVTAELAFSGKVRYVSDNGNDSNPGSQALPWRTPARVQSAIDAAQFQPGDAVLFERGHTYFGSLVLKGSLQGTAAAPIVFGAYGTGKAPVLSGMRRLQQWRSLGNGRWNAVCTECAATPALLRIDGVAQRLARWPNIGQADSGYRYFDATNGHNSITDSAMPAGSNWVGGELVVRSIAWVLDRLTIVSQQGGELTTSTDASYPLEVGWGYFIQNHPDAIDLDGEWSFNAADRSITLQSASNPNQQRIEVPARDTLVQVRGAAHVTVRDLALLGATRYAVDAQDCSGLTLRRLRAGFVGDHVVTMASCADAVVEDNIIGESMNGGVRMPACAGCIFARNTVENIGLFAGMGANGDGAYFGVNIGGVAGAPADVTLNTVADIGYLGVRLEAAVNMHGNLVRRFNRVKSDGAGIYTYRVADVTITDNTVLDAQGSTAGTPWNSAATHGIYIDDNSERITVTGNTVGRVGASAIYLHNSKDTTVTGNTLFAAGEAGLLLGDDSLGTYALENSLLRANTLLMSGVPMLRITSSVNDALFDTLGTIDGNVYCDPFAVPLIATALPSSPESRSSVGLWRSTYGRDLSSTVCAESHRSFTLTGSPGRDRASNGRFDLNLDGWFGWPSDTLDARHETGRLDGGSLRLGFAGPAPLVHFDNPVGSVDAQQSWLLEFTTIGVVGEAALSVYLRQAGTPYEPVSNAVFLPVTGARSEHALVLNTLRSESDTLLIFEMQRAGTAIGIDNVKLRPVSATPRALSDIARLETNPSPSKRSFVLDAQTYQTPDGVVYAPGSRITLQPFRSIMLIRQE